MIKLQFLVNGKEVDPSNLSAELDTMILEGFIETIREGLTEQLTQDEADQIKINFIGDRLDNLSVDVSGPEEIVAKVEESLS